MRGRHIPPTIALAVFAALAFGVPYGERWLKCRDPVSEACVWAKAYMPLSIGIGVVLGLVAGLVIYLALRAWLKPKA